MDLHPFPTIAIILAIATVVGGLAIRLRQPLIVAFIGVGIAVGPVGTGWVTTDNTIELLARLGIAILLFLVGLLRHRVFNLRFFLLRYLLYFLLVLLIFAFFLLLYAPVEGFFQRAYGLPPRLSGFLVTALLFLIISSGYGM